MIIEEFLRTPVKMGQIVQFSGDELDMYCLYTAPDVESIDKNTLFYIDGYTEIDDDDNEIYPQFIRENNLCIYFHGDIASDIIRNTKHQLEPRIPSVDEYIENFNYYNEHDCFITLA